MRALPAKKRLRDLCAVRVVGFWNDLGDHQDDPILSRRDRAGTLAAET